MQQDLHRVSRRVRVPQIEPEVRAEAMALKADDGSDVGQERARQPVVRPLDDLPRDRVVTAMEVEDMVRTCRQSRRGARSPVPYCDDVIVVVERGVKSVYPESPVLADALRRRFDRSQ